MNENSRLHFVISCKVFQTIIRPKLSNWNIHSTTKLLPTQENISPCLTFLKRTKMLE